MSSPKNKKEIFEEKLIKKHNNRRSPSNPKKSKSIDSKSFANNTELEVNKSSLEKQEKEVSSNNTNKRISNGAKSDSQKETSNKESNSNSDSKERTLNAIKPISKSNQINNNNEDDNKCFKERSKEKNNNRVVLVNNFEQCNSSNNFTLIENSELSSSDELSYKSKSKSKSKKYDDTNEEDNKFDFSSSTHNDNSKIHTNTIIDVLNKEIKILKEKKEKKNKTKTKNKKDDEYNKLSYNNIGDNRCLNNKSSSSDDTDMRSSQYKESFDLFNQKNKSKTILKKNTKQCKDNNRYHNNNNNNNDTNNNELRDSEKLTFTCIRKKFALSPFQSDHFMTKENNYTKNSKFPTLENTVEKNNENNYNNNCNNNENNYNYDNKLKNNKLSHFKKTNPDNFKTQDLINSISKTNTNNINNDNNPNNSKVNNSKQHTSKITPVMLKQFASPKISSTNNNNFHTKANKDSKTKLRLDSRTNYTNTLKNKLLKEAKVSNLDLNNNKDTYFEGRATRPTCFSYYISEYENRLSGRLNFQSDESGYLKVNRHSLPPFNKGYSSKTSTTNTNNLFYDDYNNEKDNYKNNIEHECNLISRNNINTTNSNKKEDTNDNDNNDDKNVDYKEKKEKKNDKKNNYDYFGDNSPDIQLVNKDKVKENNEDNNKKNSHSKSKSKPKQDTGQYYSKHRLLIKKSDINKAKNKTIRDPLSNNDHINIKDYNENNDKDYNKDKNTNDKNNNDNENDYFDNNRESTTTIPWRNNFRISSSNSKFNKEQQRFMNSTCASFLSNNKITTNTPLMRKTSNNNEQSNNHNNNYNHKTRKHKDHQKVLCKENFEVSDMSILDSCVNPVKMISNNLKSPLLLGEEKEHMGNNHQFNNNNYNNTNLYNHYNSNLNNVIRSSNNNGIYSSNGKNNNYKVNYNNNNEKYDNDNGNGNNNSNGIKNSNSNSKSKSNYFNRNNNINNNTAQTYNNDDKYKVISGNKELNKDQIFKSNANTNAIIDKLQKNNYNKEGNDNKNNKYLTQGITLNFKNKSEAKLNEIVTNENAMSIKLINTNKVSKLSTITNNSCLSETDSNISNTNSSDNNLNYNHNNNSINLNKLNSTQTNNSYKNSKSNNYFNSSKYKINKHNNNNNNNHHEQNDFNSNAYNTNFHSDNRLFTNRRGKIFESYHGFVVDNDNNINKRKKSNYNNSHNEDSNFTCNEFYGSPMNFSTKIKDKDNVSDSVYRTSDRNSIYFVNLKDSEEYYKMQEHKVFLLQESCFKQKIKNDFYYYYIILVILLIISTASFFYRLLCEGKYVDYSFDKNNTIVITLNSNNSNSSDDETYLDSLLSSSDIVNQSDLPLEIDSSESVTISDSISDVNDKDNDNDNNKPPVDSNQASFIINAKKFFLLIDLIHIVVFSLALNILIKQKPRFSELFETLITIAIIADLSLIILDLFSSENEDIFILLYFFCFSVIDCSVKIRFNDLKAEMEKQEFMRRNLLYNQY